MAGNIPMGSMSTEVKLDGSQSVKTLRELKQAVTQATSAWKAQRAELSTIGKSTEAAEAKYKGLAETIKKQKDYISGLQEAQKHLQEAQKSVDRSTKEGRQEYGKYNEALQKNETRIHSAEQKLVSLTNQQTKAKSSLNYYKSGLADVQKQLKVNESVAKSYVVRLKAEGKGYESAKAKLNSYKDSLANLRKQQIIQNEELSRIAKETGKSSDAYKRQEIRVNQTATSIAKLNGKIKSSQAEVNKLNPKGFNRIANGAKHVTSAADKMKAGLKHAWDNVKTGATAAAAGIGAVGAAAISGAKKAGNLQQSYKEITNLAVTGGEKQKEVLKAVTQMQRDGRDMSIKYGKSQQSIAEAYEELIKRGYTTKQALGAMRTELQGSVASGDDFKDVVSVSSTVLESFGMRAKSTAAMTSNTKRAVNELAYAADMTSTGFKDLGYGMSYVGSSAHQAGFSLSETASAMGILSNNGLEASKAGTGLNQVINRLSDATGKLVKGDKKNVLAKLGITPKEITDSKGQLKSMGIVFGVLEKHMKGMTKVQKINIMKSLFGVNGEQAGLILAKYNKELDTLSGKVLKAGKNGKYVSDLAAKNSQTAKMQMARLKQAGDAFTMTLGAKMLPAINEAGNSLVVFLTKSKDGKRLTNDFAHAVEGLATGLANTIKWIAHHRTETKLIAEGLGAAYGVVKLASFVQWINKTRLAMSGLKVGTHLINGFKHLGSAAKISGKLIKATGKGIAFAGKTMGKAFTKQLGLIGKGIKGLGKGIWSATKWVAGQFKSAGKFLGEQLVKGYRASISGIKGLFGKGTGAGKLTGLLQSAHSAGGFKKLTTAGKIGTGLAGAGIALDAGSQFLNAYKDRHNADKRSQDIGKGIGAGIGGGIGLYFGGPLGAALGSKIGGFIGKWGGEGVNQFTKGWQRQGKNQKPQNWVQWLGFQAHNSLDFFVGLGKKAITAVGKGFNNAKSFAKKNSKELALTAISPLIGIPALLYKSNPKFRKWANGVGRNVKKGLKTAGKAVNSFKNSLGRNFKKAWNSAYKHASKGTKQIMRSTEKFAKNYVKINKKANSETVKNFSSFGKRLKKNHGDLFKTIGQTAKKQLAIEKKRWSSNWKNIRSTAQGIWKGLNHNASDMYKKLNTATHGGLGKVLSGFKSFGKGIKDFWNGLWKGITKTFDDTVKNLQDAANNVDKFFHGKLKVGSLHLANGTDWRKKYGTPAVVNDAPGENYREGLLVNGQVIPFPDKRNIPFWLLPGQDIVNGNDMAKMFGHAVHYADGTVHLSKDHKYSKKNYELAKKRAVEDKKELDKLGDKISNALKHKDGNEARRLTKEFNKLTKKYSADKKAAKKPDPHAGKVLVDQGLLIGAKSRIGHSVYISKDLFKKLITNLNKKKSTTRRRATTHKRRSTTARRISTRRYSSRVTTPRISSGVSARISTVGLGSINGLSKALKRIKSKSIKVVAKASGTKAVTSLAKSVGKVKGSSHKVIIKTSGLTSLRKLAKAANKIKGKTHKVRVRTSGTKGLKSLQKNITSVHKRIDSLSKASKKDKFGKAIAKQAEEAVKSLKGKGNFTKQFNSMVKKFEKDLKAMVKTAQKEFKSMWSNMEHSSKTSQSSMLHSLSSFSKKFKHDWSSLQSGVYKSFSHFWTNMRSAAGRGVNNVIRILNSAIGKIDNVISDFGGSKTAVHKSGYVHYAGGTDANGRLTQDTLAIVNDAKSGPRQEAIITDTNDVLLPRGKDVPVMLKKGWGVLNGTQTQQLGLPHFANGTGLKGLYKLAKKYWNHPVKTGQSMFGAISGLSSAIKDLALGMRNTAEKSGVNWWSQLWKMVADKVNDDAVGKGGTREAFLKYAEKVFSGVHYQMGAASKTLSDCSGMVMQALRHFGINIGRTTVAMQESNGVQYLGKNIRKTVPGDLVIFGHGTGAAGHVGIIKNPKAGTMFNETQPYARVSRIADDVSMGYGFYRVKGLHNASDSNNPKVKANNSLQSLIKKQVGQGFWRTIQKIADKYGENSFFGGMAGKPVGDVTHWMRQAHIPKKDWAGINYIVTAESGWNPRIVNPSSGTYGLGQMQGYNLHYYTRHGSKSNPIAQLMGIMDYIHDRYGSVANAVRFRKAHNWYANGGIASTPSIFGEAGPEMAIPLIPSKSTRAWELIGKAIAILSANTTFGQQQNQIDSKEQKEEHEFRQSVLLLLRQIFNKSSVADIKLTTPAGRTLWEVVEPFSKAEQRAAMIKLRRGLSGR